LAVTLSTEDYQMIGWTPRYLVSNLISCVPNTPELSATVARINSNDAPLNQRILIDFHGRTPDGTELMATPDFRPLIIAAETGDSQDTDHTACSRFLFTGFPQEYHRYSASAG